MRLFVMILALLAAGSAQAAAQGLIAQKALSYEMAQAIVQGTVERCRADGFSVSVSVANVYSSHHRFCPAGGPPARSQPRSRDSPG